MPFVNVKVVEGVFSATQKQDIVRKVTDAMVEIEGENMRPVTWVVVEEVASGDWGMAEHRCTPLTSRLSLQVNRSPSDCRPRRGDPTASSRRRLPSGRVSQTRCKRVSYTRAGGATVCRSTCDGRRRLRCCGLGSISTAYDVIAMICSPVYS